MRQLVCFILMSMMPIVSVAEPLKAMDLFDLQWVKDPQISPDGKHIVYERHRFDVMTDTNRSSLWIIDADGSNHEPLTGTADMAAMPRWSHDGKRLAYVSDEAGSPQIHVLWMDSGNNVAITNLQAKPGSLTWSPDGSRLAFTQFVTAKREPIGEPPQPPEGAKWKPDAKVFEDFYYRSDSKGFLKAGKSQIFIVAATGGSAIQLTRKDFSHTGKLSWSADGSAIYYASNYYDNWQADRVESEIFRIKVATREHTQVTQRDGPDTAPAVSPDGKWLAYLGYDDTGYYRDHKLYISETDKHAPRLLLDLDKPIAEVQWAGNSRRLFIRYTDSSVVHVAQVDLDGEVKVLSGDLGGSAIGRPYSGGSFSVSVAGVVAHDITDSQQPANLGVTRRGKMRQLTDLNRDLLRFRSIPDVEEIWVDSKLDKLPIQGWIIKPPGFDPAKQYPLILEIHGGPHTAYGDNFSAELQLYAAAGYVVLYTNPRGSTSYGDAFANEIHHDYPGNDYYDLMSMVDAVIEQGYVDDGNLFVTGGSGGGILTAWIVTQTDRFRAAVSQKPVINWLTLTLTSDIGPHFWPLFFSGLPWEKPEEYFAKSPISMVDQVTTPTMLLTGEQDFRTPMSEAEQFYQGLQMQGVDTALVRIQSSSHSIAKTPSNLLRKVSYVLGWFERYRLSAHTEGGGATK